MIKLIWLLQNEFNSEHQISQYINKLEETDKDNTLIEEWKKYNDVRKIIVDVRKTLDGCLWTQRSKDQLEEFLHNDW